MYRQRSGPRYALSVLCRYFMLPLVLVAAMGCTKDSSTASDPANETERATDPGAGQAVKPSPPAVADAGSQPAPRARDESIDSSGDAVGDAAAPVADECRVMDELKHYVQHSLGDLDHEQKVAMARKQANAMLPPDQAEAAVGAMAIAIRDALARERFGAVATYVKNRRGICLRGRKGGECVWMSASQLGSCKSQKRRTEWDIDTGADELPRYRCLQAFRKIFMAHPELRNARPSFNCFRERGDNNYSTLVSREPAADLYVELFADDYEAPGPGDEKEIEYHSWLGLWLLFAKKGETYSLVGMTSHYWGI